jgi:MoaA/NifB/PqqE/SkfB family radical SAM enzyme
MNYAKQFMIKPKINFWDYQQIQFLHIELSNLCNAACPNCPRYLHHSSAVNPQLELTSITIEQFKKWFPVDFVARSRYWTFCGTNGDPTMAKDLYEILEYVCRNSTATVQVNTNGGVRTPEFYKKIGDLFLENSVLNRFIVFSVDGLEDTNHIYRRNVKWNKVFENMKAYCSTGAKSDWDFLVFKHNEHQVEQAKQLATQIGITHFRPKKALGFDAPDLDSYMDMKVFDKNGTLIYKIEPPSIEWRNDPSRTTRTEDGFDQVDVVNWVKKKSIVEIQEELNNADPYVFPDHLKNISIQCKSCKDNNRGEIYIDANGNVFPCCYVGTWFNSYFQIPAATQLKKIIYDWGIENLNLNFKTLQEIVCSGYFQKNFVNKWSGLDNEKLEHCFSTCGTKFNSVDNIFIVKT